MKTRTRRFTVDAWLGCAIIAALGVAGIGCGPSSAEIRKARTAVYKCHETTVFDGIVAAVKSRSGNVMSSQARHVVMSDYRWHKANGVPYAKGAAFIGAGDLGLSYTVIYVRREPGWFIKAKVGVISHVVGSPRGRELTRKDGDWPDWANDKLDTLVVGIHKKLKSKCPEVVYATAGSSPAT